MVKFVAAIAGNHNKDLTRCLEFVSQAKSMGCDAVKFPLFKTELVFAERVLERSDEVRRHKAFELPEEFIPKLANYCRQLNIEFGCSAHDLGGLHFLGPYVSFYMIEAHELLWDGLLIEAARTGKPVLLSTGMADMAEIKQAVGVLLENQCKNLTLMHCVMAYPTPARESNLAAIASIRRETDCAMGWSDYTVSPAVIHRAIHKWDAQVVQLVMDLDGKGMAYSRGHCWLPEAVGEVIGSVRMAVQADGSGIKMPLRKEKTGRAWRTDPRDGLRPLREVREQLT